MEAISERIAYYLQRYRDGDGGAFHSLIEMDHCVIPELITKFRNEPDASLREFIVEIIWQHRDPLAIPFLGEALQDSEPAVWKEAIDGLVTLASPAALKELHAAKGRHFASKSDAEEFRGWIDEAIQQIADKHNHIV